MEAAGGDEFFDYAGQPCRTVPELVELHRTGNYPAGGTQMSLFAAPPTRCGLSALVQSIGWWWLPRWAVRAPFCAWRSRFPAAHRVQRLGFGGGYERRSRRLRSPTTVADCGLGTGSFFTVDVCEPHTLVEGYLPYRMAVRSGAAGGAARSSGAGPVVAGAAGVLLPMAIPLVNATTRAPSPH